MTFSILKHCNNFQTNIYRQFAHFSRETSAVPGDWDRTGFEARPTQRHSEKPAGFYRHIAANFPGPRLDVFSRRAHPGFEGWGLEAEEEGAGNRAFSGRLL